MLVESVKVKKTGPLHKTMHGSFVPSITEFLATSTPLIIDKVVKHFEKGMQIDISNKKPGGNKVEINFENF